MSTQIVSLVKVKTSETPVSHLEIPGLLMFSHFNFFFFFWKLLKH